MDIKIPPRGSTAKCVQPQYRTEMRPGWCNAGFPVTIADAERMYNSNPEQYVSGKKRFCLVVPMEIETRLEFSLKEVK